MKPEDVKKEQELNEEELDNVSGGAEHGHIPPCPVMIETL